MNLAWLAAILSPFEIAPHPNFGSATGYRPEADLARFVLERTLSWDSLDHKINAKTDPPRVDESVKLVHDVFHEVEREDAQNLDSYLAAYPPDGDGAQRTALTVLAAFLAASDDNLLQCFSLVRESLDALVGDDPETRLCRAVLLQQRALRQYDAGVSAAATSVEVAELLQHLNVDDFAEFELNGVTKLSSAAVVARMVEGLRRAAWSTAGLDAFDPNGIGAIPSRRDQALTGDVGQFSRIRSGELGEYYSQTEDEFALLFDRTRRTRFGGRTPDLFFEMLQYELYGHAGVNTVRKQLAMMRSVQRFPALEGGNVGMSLRMLRQAGVEEELRQLVDHVESCGPLDGVIHDARRILKYRDSTEYLRTVELVVLEAAADVLPEEEAGRALELVLTVIDDGGPIDPPGRWQIASKRYETACDSAISVGEATGGVGRVADHLLKTVTAERIGEELWDRAFARAIRQIDWEKVPPTTTRAWHQRLHSAEFLSSISTRAFDRNTPPEEDAASSDGLAPQTLADCAELINRHLRHNKSIPDAVVERAADLSLRAIDQIRAEAPGRYGHRATDPAEVMAVLIGEASRGDLLDPLLAFLSDRRVPRVAKRRAFDLLTVPKLDITPEVLAPYRAALLAVMASRDPFEMFDNGSAVLFPAAMRFVATYGLIGVGEAFKYVWALASADDRFNRLEAVRTIEALAHASSITWLPGLALQATYDPYPDVKAAAIDVLASIRPDLMNDLPTVAERLIEILDDDGILVPLAALRAIAHHKLTDKALNDKVKALRVEHISRRVRAAAARVSDPIASD